MSVLLLTYDLNKEPNKHDYNGFYKVRDSYDHVRLSESSYALNTNESPEAVYQKVRPYMDENDYVYVITLRRPYTGYGRKSVNQWLEKNLPR